MSEPMLTIVTPTLNAGRWLKRSLASVRTTAETLPFELEQIVVDGGSDDDTISIAREFSATIVEERDRGMYEAINKGLELAKGSIFGYLNADDELTDGAIARVVAALERHPTRQWLVAPTIFIDLDGRELAEFRPPRWLSAPRFRALTWNCLPQPSTFLRTAFVRELGGFDTDFRLAGDYDLFARALERARPLYLDEPLSKFLIHGRSLSSTRTRELLDEGMRVSDSIGVSPAKRAFLKLVTSLQINAQNPRWSWAKLTGRIH